MNEFLDTALTKAAPTLVAFIVGPIATWAAKQITIKGRSLQSPKLKLVISSTAGAISAFVVGDVNGLAEALGNIFSGIIGGLGGAKARDMRMGRTEAVTPSEKVTIEEAGTFGRYTG